MKRYLKHLLTFSVCCFVIALFTSVIPVKAAPNYYTINGTTITVNVANGSDITFALDKALEQAKILGASGTVYTVKVPAGNYKTSDILHIYSNTTLSMHGVTLTSSAGNFNMLISGTTSYNNSEACSGYSGFKNITLDGGNWVSHPSNNKTQIRLFHATDVTVKDISISGGASNHQLEVAAINNFKVTNCTFKDMTKTTSNAKREALQLDLAIHSSIYPDVIMDGTMMKNVVISDCTFSNVSRGIGSHSLLNGAYMENIEIKNNTFQNVEKECITALNYYNANISNNTMKNCGTGILFQYSKGDADTIFTTLYEGSTRFKGSVRHNAASVITKNTIQTKYNPYCDENQGIKLYGRKISSKEKNKVDHGTVPTGDYYLSDVTVTNNNITSSGYGISLDDSKNCTIVNNTITCTDFSSKDPIAKQKKYNGIHLGKTSTGNVIKDNFISNAQQNGIYMQDKSSAKEISGNTITAPGKNGIHLYSGSKITGSISKNTIVKAKSNAVSIDDKSCVSGNISENIIRDSKNAGIYILNKASVKNITDNKITNSAKNGIWLNNHATVKGNISDNTLKTCKINGIYIFKATVKGSVNNNSVSSVKENGIIINESSKIKGSLLNNNITSAKKYGIYVLNHSSAAGLMTNNTIEKTAQPIVIGLNGTGNIGTNNISKNTKNIYQIFGNGGFTTKELKAPSLSNVSGKSKKISASWKKLSGADGYRVEVSAKKDFSSAKKLNVTSKKAVIKNLKKGKTYYVRVCAFKNSIKIIFTANTATCVL